MRVKFSKSVAFTPTWNDNLKLPENERIQATLKPLEFDDLMTMMDAFGGANVVREAIASGAEAAQDQFDITKMLRNVGDILPRYVTITGLEDDDGPVDIDGVVRYPTYMGLAAELLIKVSEISMPTESDEKN
jgi:hypothetical protein